MRRKRKLKTSVKLFILLLLILFIVFIVLFIWKYLPFSQGEIKDFLNNKNLISDITDVKPIVKVNKVSNSANTTIKEEWQKAITDYLDSYYNSLVKLEVVDPREFFTDKDSAEAYLTYKATELIVEHHKMQDNDMHLTEAIYDLNYKKVSVNNNIITIELLRDDVVNFKFLKGIQSKTYNMTNTFVLRNTNGKITIDSIRIVQDYYIMFTRALDMSSSSLKTKIDNLYNKYISNSKTELEKNRKLVSEAGNYQATKKFDYAYNREKAREYAIEYVNKRNPNYTAYDSYGGNCMNFASQAMYAGGIPMDIYGSAQWKHYSSTINNSNTASGRTASWTGTTSFYAYAQSNTGYGLVSDVKANMFDGEAGDIAQVGWDGYSHTTIVIDQIKNDEGKVVDLLINCNTLSLENYPFLAYVYQNKRVIKILGYNK